MLKHGYIFTTIFINSISQDVVMYITKHQNKSYHVFTLHFMLGFNISYKTTLPAWPISGNSLGQSRKFSVLITASKRLCRDNIGYPSVLRAHGVRKLIKLKVVFILSKIDLFINIQKLLRNRTPSSLIPLRQLYLELTHDQIVSRCSTMCIVNEEHALGG